MVVTEVAVGRGRVGAGAVLTGVKVAKTGFALFLPELVRVAGQRCAVWFRLRLLPLCVEFLGEGALSFVRHGWFVLVRG